MKRLRDATRRWWRRFFLAPLYSLPGVLIFGVANAVACLILASWFAFQAMRSEDPKRQHSSVILGIAALLCALQWTILSAVPISLVAWALWTMLRPWW